MESEPVGNKIDLQDLYKISKVAVENELKPALIEISQLIRKLFIYDNMVIYQADESGENIDVLIAKAVGRGKAGEADVSWGESTAGKILLTRQTIIDQISGSSEEDRLNQPYILGIPLQMNQILLGALIFVRFGGPEYKQNEVMMAECIARQISILMDRERIGQKYITLEAQHEQNLLKDDFISTITHELRNPLGFIKGYTTTLLRSDTTWDQQTQSEFLEIIDHETDHLQELIDNLLDSARLKSGQLKMKFQEVRPDALLKDLQLRCHMNYPDLKISINIPQTSMPIQADGQRLSQVFENLINNAIKYAPGSEIQIQYTQSETESRFRIQDFGNGIPEKYLPHIFERFFRNPEQSPNIHGSGLGLYICRKIIEAHHGKITVESTVGKGTCFEVILPNDLQVK